MSTILHVQKRRTNWPNELKSFYIDLVGEPSSQTTARLSYYLVTVVSVPIQKNVCEKSLNVLFNTLLTGAQSFCLFFQINRSRCHSKLHIFNS